MSQNPLIAKNTFNLKKSSVVVPRSCRNLIVEELNFLRVIEPNIASVSEVLAVHEIEFPSKYRHLHRGTSETSSQDLHVVIDNVPYLGDTFCVKVHSRIFLGFLPSPIFGVFLQFNKLYGDVT